MRTVIVRLSDPIGDGRLHGLVEVVGNPKAIPFTDDTQLLELLQQVGSPVMDGPVSDPKST